MSAPLGPPGRRTPCGECGRRGHTARSHEPGGLLYVAVVPQAGPDLLAELAEVERTPAQLLADAVESVRTSDQVPKANPLGPLLAEVRDVRRAALTAQQLADAETAARRLDQVRRFITPAGDDPVEGASADLAEPEDAQVAGLPVLGPEYDDAQHELNEAAELADPDPMAPGESDQENDCDCWHDGDWHPAGSGGCTRSRGEVLAARLADQAALVDPDADEGYPLPGELYAGAVPEQLQDDRRPIEDVELPDVIRDAVTHQLGPGERQATLDRVLGPGPFGPPWATSAGPDARPRITLPGVYQLSDTEYHDPAVTGEWVSNSDLKAMSLPGAPAKWKFKRDNGIRDERDVFQFGKAAHRRVLGVGAAIVVRPDTWQDWRKQAAKDWRAEQQAAGRVVVTPDEAEVIEAMAAAMLANEHAAALLSRPGRGEVALFWRELLPSGRWVQRRAMLDFLPDSGPIADYKTCVSAAPDDQMSRDISRFRYHRQAATYTAAVVALDLPAEADIVFLFQEKTAPYLVTPVNLDDPTMMAAEIQNRQGLEVYVDCLESGVWPGYTDGTVTMSIPEYELREYEQEIK